MKEKKYDIYFENSVKVKSLNDDGIQRQQRFISVQNGNEDIADERRRSRRGKQIF